MSSETNLLSDSRLDEIIEEGVETDRIEFKDARTQAPPLAKELVAMANSEGGHLIHGVKESDGKIESIQGISNPSEVEESVNNSLAQSVVPPLNIRFREFEQNGKVLSAFYVDSAKRLRSYRGNGGVTFPIRRGTITDYLDARDLEEHHQKSPISREYKQTERTSTRSSETNQSAAQAGVARGKKLSISNNTDAPVYSGPENRAVISVGDMGIVVPTNRLLFDTFHLDQLIYHTQTNIGVNSSSDIVDVLQAAESELEVDLEKTLSYAITLPHDELELVGRNVKSLVEDSERITDVIRMISSGEGSPKDPRPIAVLASRSRYGLFWMQLQWRDRRLRPGHCEVGIIMPDIPLQNDSVVNFFKQVGSVPLSYRQNGGVQVVDIRGQELTSLQNPVATKLTPDAPPSYTEIVADNPFYCGETEFAFSFDFSEFWKDALEGINRIPYDVAGGWIEEDEDFTFDMMQLVYKALDLPTYFIYGLCRPVSK